MAGNDSDWMDLLTGAPQAISDAFMKAHAVINMPRYERNMCSVSSSADSDVMMDMIWRMDEPSRMEGK